MMATRLVANLAAHVVFIQPHEQQMQFCQPLLALG